MLQELHPFLCKAVNIGRFKFFLSVAAQIAVAKIIGQDVNDVGLFIVCFFGIDCPHSFILQRGNGKKG